MLKSDGALTPIETKAVPGPTKPGGSLPMAVSPDKKWLYVGLRNEPFTAVTFAIDKKTGKLSWLAAARSPIRWPMSPPTAAENSC